MNVTLIKKIQEAENIYSFLFKSENKLKWKAGQYIFLKIPHKNPDDRGEERHFTISSAPFEENIMITTKFDFKGGSSFKKALLQLNEGGSIEMYNLEGDFIIRDSRSKYVFIAGGIGITPYRSIMMDLVNRGKKADIILLYFCKTSEIIFKDIFDKIERRNSKIKIHYITEPQRVNEDIIKSRVQDFNERILYASGPYLMVKAVEDVLSNLNVKEKNIIKDYFPGY
jgi:glycine betaine catabolism B